ncbi:TlpA disulfide reductase family protein [Arcicella aquatica]|uniref:TlpA disulfide reductase family protein n=1 Tax=Arcicella aquatica TaxID=217141 RepID=A0ABU5QRU6_9BACT|nr:TlpA disulfide reductase family protein [Arcicella aquatica]MEA5259414.1 TlpA disulfide reductase family protein [Arcicella aquatica]
MLNHKAFLLTPFFFFLITQYIHSQTVKKIFLQKQIGVGPFYNSTTFLNLRPDSLYRFPDMNISKSIVKRAYFQKEKQLYEEYLKGGVSEEEFEGKLKIYKILPLIVSKPRKTAYYVDFFIGEINKNKRVIIADINRNSDFRDDTPYYIEGDFSLKSKDIKDEKILKQLPVIAVKYEFDNGQKTQWIKTIVKLNPFKTGATYGNPIEDDLYLMIEHFYFNKGSFKVNGEEYVVVSSNTSISAEFNESKTSLFFFKKEDYKQTLKPNVNLISFKAYDSLRLGNVNFYISKISLAGDTLYMRSTIKSKHIIGIQVGNYITNSLYFDNIEKDKYLLIDFWGTWCAPCIENLPELKKIYEKLDKTKIQLLSIASDSDSLGVNKIIKKYDMSWLNKSENYQDNGFVKKLRVNTFPSIILASPTGQILERKIGSKTMIFELNKKLEELRLFNK